MSNLATGSTKTSSNGLLAGHLVPAFDRDSDLLCGADRITRRTRGRARSADVAPSLPTRQIVDLNDRIRRISTRLSTLSGPGNDLWIDLCAGPVPLHCAPEQLELALIEAVTHMRGLLSGPGTIAVRTRRVNFHAILALGAREGGAAAFGSGSLRVPPRAALTTLFGAARGLAARAHGRVRLHGSATLILRLPTVLRLAAGRRPNTSATTPHSRPKEKTHEDRQPVAA